MRLGHCDGPNFLAMEPNELGLWCNEMRKQRPELTYERIAAHTGLSKGTISSFLTGDHEDYRVGTVRSLVKLITNGKWSDNPCATIDSAERKNYEDQIAELENELSSLDDRIALLQESIKTHAKSLAFLHGQIKLKNIALVILSALFILCCLAFIFSLSSSVLHPSSHF